MLELTGKGGLATQMFAALSRELPQGSQDAAKVVEVLTQNGVAVAS